MNRTFVTKMPNHIGAFLKASEIFASLNINITRVSYNKAVDSHLLFIDVEGTSEQLQKANDKLYEIGYLQCGEKKRNVVLFEFKLNDVPGSVTEILRIISKFNLNISYLSSQENGTEYQLFKMGIIVEENSKINEFINEAKLTCPLKVIEYNKADNVYDNSFFYESFADELTSLMELSDSAKNELIINTNLAMQILDELGTSPYRTFDSISRFCELLSVSRNENFNPRITSYSITDDTEITVIEPPCGSNTIIIKSNGEYLFIDSGYACYEKEMIRIFKDIVPDFDGITKKVFITHADVDHCGLLPIFDEVYASAKSAESLTQEYNGNNNFRETNHLHKPYIRICNILTSYKPVNPDKITIIGENRLINEPVEQTGYFDFGQLHFTLYEGKGGHLKGESVLVDFEHKLVFSGDIFINMKDMIPEQAEYNQYAPILMTSVDSDKQLCARERSAIFDLIEDGEWYIFGGHGAMKEFNIIK